MSESANARRVITGIIPCHNHQNWINDALMSMVGQDRPPDQIVVVDDGSTDRSFEVVRERMTAPTFMQEKDHFSCWGDYQGIPLTLHGFPQARGPAFARNFAMQFAWAKTDIFALLDSDDLYEQGKISLSLRVFDQHGDDVALVYSDYETFNPQTGVRVREYKEPFSRQRLLRECLPNCDSLISKKALAECGVFDPEMRVCEDYDLWMRLSEKFLLFHIPSHLLTIRVGDHSSTAKVRDQVWKKCYARVFEKANERMKNARK